MVMIAATLTYIVLFVAAVAVVWRQHMWENYKAAMVASWCHLAVAIPLVLLLSALVGLHIYLIAKGLTTFEFIMKKRS